MATRCPVHTPEAANAVFTMLEDVGLGMERMNTHEPVNIPFTPDAATELWTKGKTFTGGHGQHTGRVFFAQHVKPSVGLHVSWQTSPDFDCVSIITLDVYKGQFLKQQEAMVRIFESLIWEFTLAYAYIGSWAGFLRQGCAVWASIPGIYWMNILEQEYVGFIAETASCPAVG